MLLIDLVSSINHALPQLAGNLATTETIFGPDIGYGLLKRRQSIWGDALDVAPADTWSGMRPSTLGVLGADPIRNNAIAAIHRRFGAAIPSHPWPAKAIDAETIEADDNEPELDRGFREALDASVICVVLPWHAQLSEYVSRNKLTPVKPQAVLVIWRRSPRIERALVYLGRHYDEPVQLQQLAQVACTSKCHLVRLFASALGMTPHRYQLALRLFRAKALLREGACITQIAHGLGFSDQSHMGRSFRVLLGMSPTEYQRAAEH